MAKAFKISDGEEELLRRIIIKGDIYILWSLLIFSMLSFPRSFQLIKLIVLCILLIDVMAYRSTIELRKHFRNFIVLWIAYFIYVSIIGLIRGNSIRGIFEGIKLNILYVIVLLRIEESVAKKPGILIVTIKTIYFAALYIGIFNLLLLVQTYLGIDSRWMIRIDPFAIVGIHKGYSHIIATNLSMSIILFPFMMMLVEHEFVKKYIGRKYALSVTALLAIAMILSGRRIIWLVLVFSISAYLFMYSQTPPKLIRNITIGMFVLLLGIFLIKETGILHIEDMVSRFLDAFSRNSTEGGGSNIRIEQIDGLIDGFLRNPILGSGSAGVIDGLVRNMDRNWLFEMSYHVILFNGGLLGSGLYFGSLWAIYYHIKTIKRIDHKLYHALQITYIMCLIANATNPYFSSSFDFLCMLIIPLFCVDCVSPKNREGSHRYIL